MKYIFPDFETYCDLDIKHVSTDRYASHPSTKALMCAFAFDDAPVELWQTGDSGLEGLKRDLRTHIIVPWNASFERAISRFVWHLTGLKWRDAMVSALYAGLPAHLKGCNQIPWFKNESETYKATLLINKFCRPQKNGEERNRQTDPEDWQTFCDYCKADVHDTRLIFQWLEERMPVPERVWKEWELDQEINWRGMPIDRTLTQRAWLESQRLQIQANARLADLTGLGNPNSSAQLLPWLQERGYPFGSLGKELVLKALKEEPDTEDIPDDDE